MCIRDSHRIKKELSICQSLLCLDLVSFPVLSQIKPQAPGWSKEDVLIKGKTCLTRCSSVVTQHSTNLAQCSLSAGIGRVLELSTWCEGTINQIALPPELQTPQGVVVSEACLRMGQTIP